MPRGQENQLSLFDVDLVSPPVRSPVTRRAPIRKAPIKNASKRGSLILNVDAGSRGNPGPSACAFVAEGVEDAEGVAVSACIGRFLGRMTNNEAEYQGLLDALGWLCDQKRTGADIRMDSKLVVMQVTGRWKVKEPRLMTLATEARRLLSESASKLSYVPREKNRAADAEVNRVLDLEKFGGR